MDVAAEISTASKSLARDIVGVIDRMRRGATTVSSVNAVQFQDLFDRLQRLHKFIASLSGEIEATFARNSSPRKEEYQDAIKFDLDMFLGRMKTAVNVSSVTYADGAYIRRMILNLKWVCGESLSDWKYDMGVGGFQIEDYGVWFFYYLLGYHLVRIGSSTTQYKNFKQALVQQHRSNVKPAIQKRKKACMKNHAISAALSLFEMNKFAVAPPARPLDINHTSDTSDTSDTDP